MHQSIIGFFENSLSFGFTGTPILRENSGGGRTTKDIFKKILHTYLIKDAIADENVLGFSVDYYGGAELKKITDEEVHSIDKKEFLENENQVMIQKQKIVNLMQCSLFLVGE